ncbi:Serine/threonine-protein kinase smg1 [Rhizophlyctis rosea]|nr:Serine/threonine-protein kinase smg1 [Rhizophlyctis rosea]
MQYSRTSRGRGRGSGGYAQAQYHQHPRDTPAKYDRAYTILGRAFKDESDPMYTKRTQSANQFVAFYAGATGSSDANFFVSDGLIRMYGEVIYDVLGDPRTPNGYKTAIVRCIVAIGSVYVAQATPFLAFVFDRLNSTQGSNSKDKEVKIWLLTALREFVGPSSDQLDGQRSEILLAGILSNLQTFLDSMESHEFLPKVLDILTLISDKYPQIFNDAFKDVVDLVVGWGVDPSVPRSTQALISDSFKRLWRFWRNHMDFGLELLRHLIMDVEELVGVKSEPGVAHHETDASKLSSRAVGKVLTLTRVYQSIFLAVSFGAFPRLNPDTDFEWDDETERNEFYHLMHWTLKFFQNAGMKVEDRSWIALGMEMVKTFSRALHVDFVLYQADALAVYQVELDWHLDEYEERMAAGGAADEAIRNWLTGLNELIECWAPHFHESTLRYFLCPSDSIILEDLRLAICDSRPLVQLLSQTCRQMYERCGPIDSTFASEPRVEIFVEAQDLFDLLVEHDTEALPDHAQGPRILYEHNSAILEQEAKWFVRLDVARSHSKTYAESYQRVAELEIMSIQSILCFDLQLATAATQIGVAGLPMDGAYWVFRSLLSSCIEPGSKLGSSEWAPNVEMELISALFRISQRSAFFIGPAVTFDERKDRTAIIFSELSTIHRLLRLHIMSEAKLTALWWLQGMLMEYGRLRSTRYTIEAELWKVLGDCIKETGNIWVFGRDPLLRKEAVATLLQYFKGFPYFDERLKSVAFDERILLSQAMNRLQDTDEDVRTSAFELLTVMNPAVLLAAGASSMKTTVNTFAHELKAEVLRLPFSGTFRTQHFITMMTFLGLGHLIRQKAEEDVSDSSATATSGWLQRLFHSCQTGDALKQTTSPQSKQSLLRSYWDAIDLSDDFLMFWALWETARYCIVARMRTPLGTAVQTFEALEHTVEEYISTLSAFKEGTTEATTLEIVTVLNRLRHLLKMVDFLEMQYQDVTKGSGAFPSVPKASILFFSANRRSCEEWFSRVRQKILVGLKYVGGSAGMIIRHGLEQNAVKDRVLWTKNLETAMTLTAEACVSARDPDLIVGLSTWWKKFEDDRKLKEGKRGKDGPVLLLRKKSTDEIGPPPLPTFNWLPGSALAADGRYEEAATQLQAAVPASLGWKEDPESLAVRNMIAECFLASENYTAMDKWLTQLREPDDLWEPIAVPAHVDAYLRQWTNVLDADNVTETAVDFESEVSAKRMLLGNGAYRASLRLSDSHILRPLSLAWSTSSGDTAYNRRRDIVKSTCEALECLQTLAPLYSSEDEGERREVLLQAQIMASINQMCALESDVQLSARRVGNAVFTEELRSRDVQLADVRSLWPLRILSEQEFDLKGSGVGGGTERREDLGMRRGLARIARKSGNLKLARRLLILPSDGGEKVVDQYQLAKVAFTSGRPDEGLHILISLIDGRKADTTEERLLLTKAHLRVAQSIKLVDWSRADPDLLSAVAKSAPAATSPPHLVAPDNHEWSTEQHLRNAITYSPTDGKAWFALGSHRYRQGRKFMEAVAKGGRGVPTMFVPERSAISRILDGVGDESTVQATLEIFLNDLNERNAPEIASDEQAHPSLEELISNAHPDLKAETVDRLVSAAKDMYQRLVHCYEEAASAYFQFLELDGATVAEEGSSSDCNRFTATLRILRMLVKYGYDLKDLFVEKFAATPILPWEDVIPQLFARLDHPEPSVRQQLAGLLSRIGSSSPHLIVYQTVVDALDASAGNESSDSYHQILASLDEGGSGDLISQVRKMVQELQKVTVLWEEMWFHKLIHVEVDAQKRLGKLQVEADRLGASITIAPDEVEKINANRYATVMQPVYGTLDKLYAQTVGKGVVSGHQKWFVDKFGDSIGSAMAELRKPASFAQPKDAWNPFKELHTALGKEVQRPRQLALGDLSSFLASARVSDIPIPGLPVHDTLSTVQSFDQVVHVLPTKTKPKKMTIVGSNGERYTYLFKGLEDLHLDERIQQFLRTINKLLARDKDCARRDLRARTYAVIPFGERFGMIQWIGGATQLYSLYKRWQQRDHAIQMLQRKEGEESNIPPIRRPNEHFASKVGEAFARHNIPRDTPRRQWPQALLAEVFHELESEVPNQLIAKELWCSSPTSNTWLGKSATYSRSVAVMSMIGHIIGLGDRHLDNILLDSNIGEVIHIDYNVSFETGKKLRIPETVPFRLTQNVKGALGLTGVEGRFRIAAEHTLRVLRENREMLMTLLEAFVYDPLVDWTKDETDDLERKLVEINVQVGLLGSRISEMKHLIEQHRNEFADGCRRAADIIRAYDHQADVESMKSLDLQPAEVESSLVQRLNDCKSWRLQHEQALANLQGPMLQAYAMDVLDNGPIFPPFAQATVMLGAPEATIARAVNMDNQLLQLGQDRNACVNLCLEHLHLYRALAMPIAEALLGQDYYGQWEKVLTELASEGFIGPECKRIARSGQSPFVASMDERKSAIIEHMKHALEKETVRVQQYTQTLQSRLNAAITEESGLAARADGLKFLEAVCRAKGPQYAQSLLECAIAEALAHHCKALTSLIDGDVSTPRDSLEHATAVFGEYGYEPAKCTEKYICVVSMLCTLKELNGFAEELDCGSIMEPRQLNLIKSYASLALETLSVRWHVAEILLPTLLACVLRNKEAVEQLHDRISMIEADDTDADSVAAEPFETLRNQYKSDTSENQILFGTLDGLFLQLEERMQEVQEHALPQTTSVGRQLFGLKLRLITSFLSAILAYHSAEHSDADPSDEWTHSVHFKDAFVTAPVFAESTSLLKSYLEVYEREAFLSPFTSFVGDVLNSMSVASDDNNVLAESPNEARLSLVEMAKRVAETKRGIGLLSSEVTKVAEVAQSLCTIDVEGILHTEASNQVRRAQVHLRQQNLSVMRYQFLHEAQISAEIDDIPQSPRLQFIENIRASLHALRTLMANLTSLEETCSAFEAEMVPLLSAASVDPTKLPAVQAVANMTLERHAAFGRQRQKGLLDLANLLVHFESFRVPNAHTKIMDVDTIDLISKLRAVRTIAAETSPTHVGESIEPSTYWAHIVALDSTWKAVVDTMRTVHSFAKPALRQADELPEAKGIADSLRRLWDDWDGAKQSVETLLSRQDDQERAPEVDMATKWDRASSLCHNVFNFVLSLTSVKELRFEMPSSMVNGVQKTGVLPPLIAVDLTTSDSKLLSPKDLLRTNVEQGGQSMVINLKAAAHSPDVNTGLNGIMDDGRAEESQTSQRSPLQTKGRVRVSRGQERNAYAVGVLKRVRAKLEGREGNDESRMSIPEQVEHLFQQATDVRNLAVMYEGWMGWI